MKSALKSNLQKKSILIYATANESNYLVDYQNMKAMTQFHPGVDHIILFVIVSAVKAPGLKDRYFEKILTKLMDQCPWIVLKKVIYKGNEGRDFSSIQKGIKQVSKIAIDSDLIMVRNRSAYGPFQQDWFKVYADLLDVNPNIGLTGNTINLTGHPKRHDKEKGDGLLHVQTYLYMSRFEALKSLRSDFPGVKETDRYDLIEKGEIRLSQILMERGYLINCLCWPTKVFGKNSEIDQELPRKDMKQNVLGLPFEHRRSKIKYVSWKMKMRWFFWKLIDFAAMPFEKA